MSESATTALPPGPRLPAAVQTWMWLRHGLRFVEFCQRRYGPVSTQRISSVGTVVYLTDPADIKAVFAGDPHVFHAGEANSMLKGVLGDTSVLVIDDDVHRDRRRLMLPPFQRDAVTKQAAVMAEVAAADIAGWPTGVSFPVAPRMAAITLEVILRTVIGASDPTRLAALRTGMPRLLRISPWETLAVANPKLQRRWPWRRLRRALAEADQLLYAEIADRRADPELASRTDTLAMLVRASDDGDRTMTDRELRDQLMTLLVAGHETTANGLSWALERLTRHPAVLAKAVAAAEASAAGDPAGDEYLDAVCKETLRARTVVFDVGRVLTEPVEIAGYRLPAGTMVVPGMVRVHADAELYPDPERFDPDRMLGATLSPSTWFPFGGGNRRCLGATFAMVEMRVVLREVLRRVELATTSAPGERPTLKQVVFVPHRGARVRVRSVRNVLPSGVPASVDQEPAPGCPATRTGPSPAHN
ncbi:cytochrome P450 [Mycolicibacterium confluentis]|uniref:Putative cytochrome P450 135B1 n=1 Tax=Mycolicibacterium confluentis TaxID=28047 RepID=A0A7I7Y468_9MYCO|nr:cytochrome P450 [Mycolicibacterium confluentis]MCV7319333.1 cytochrome P450 [Mycolicibacterium confluentis]ORV25729.1 cytochrome P450 [Mycolicibacterium confluentis]BBZ36455.1 putative cytochrome P450 135B1 [Mycolicibacterium confluentis]